MRRLSPRGPAPNDSPNSRFCRFCCTAAAAVLAGCASVQLEPLAQVSDGNSDRHLEAALGVDACRDAIAAPGAAGGPELDPQRIRLANWNVAKKSGQHWKHDFDALATDTDLVLIQEASLREDTIGGLDGDYFWSFAPGYRSGRQISGVLTLSAVEPVTSCSFVSLEPLTRTPKATSITEYGITGSDQTLVVVNLHAINFSLGLGAFREQFERVRAVLARHDGPLVLAGDFNTWRPARQRIVEELGRDLGLAAVRFDDDRRSRVFGQVLDHLYVRGLRTVHAETRGVTTSDHNPMSATLGL